ncbi:hypothetical protein QJS66_21675 [Kocuria rhizophila]|nr:hypothetical protein QJS66_21675 [Kocuria rhizophila]
MTLRPRVLARHGGPGGAPGPAGAVHRGPRGARGSHAGTAGVGARIRPLDADDARLQPDHALTLVPGDRLCAALPGCPRGRGRCPGCWTWTRPR